MPTIHKRPAKKLDFLVDALIAAFPTHTAFKAFGAFTGLIDNLDRFVAPGTLKSVVHEVIRRLAAEGKLDEFVEAFTRWQDDARLKARAESVDRDASAESDDEGIAAASVDEEFLGSFDSPRESETHEYAERATEDHAWRGSESLAPSEAVDASPVEASNAETFYFVLRGASAKGNTIAAGSVAKLLFDYAVPPEDALALANADALDAAKATNAEMYLVVTARGALAVVGRPMGRACFENGRLQAPLSFDLQAGDEPGDASLHVAFLIRGELIHETEIAITVTEPRKGTQAQSSDTRAHADGMLRGTLQDVVATTPAAPRQRIVLALSFAAGFLRISLTDFRDGEVEFADDYQSTTLDATRVDTLLRGIHRDLRSCYDDEEFWLHFDGTLPEGDERRLAVDALGQTLEGVAAAGSRLNEELRADARVAEALDYVEQNGAQGAVISVQTDNTFLPWEFLYPEHRTANMSDEEKLAKALAPQAFWGARFAIETEKRGIGSLTRLRNEHVRAPPKVTVNLNPLINIKGAMADRQPLAIQRAWARQLAQRGQLDGIQDTCKDVRPVVQWAVKESTLIYVYCHGSAPDAFSGTDESLVLDAKCSLEPRDLREGPVYRGAPIVFLNSCKGGVSSPLRFSGFLKEFRARGALGLIATSFSIPIAFGASFGQEVVDCYLNRKGSLAIEMLTLRRRHLVERGNPVPLFYTLQCHLDVAAA